MKQKIFRLLADLRFAIFILLLISFCSIIGTIIEQEDPTKPLSDRKIVDLLAEKEIKLARRTVAKYREELGISPTNLRRRY